MADSYVISRYLSSSTICGHFRSATGTSTSTKDLGPTCDRSGSHCPNGEAAARLLAALQDGKVSIADVQGELVRLPAGAWQMLAATIRDGLSAHPCSGCGIANGGELQNPHHDPLTALEVAVLRVNHRQQIITGRAEEVVRNCRQVYDPIFLRRSPHNELEFAEFITAFARLMYDGTNGVTSAADRGTVTPTLPKWCYRDHRSVIVHVIVLRNHYLHGLSPNETTAEEHLASAGDVFEIYAAKRVLDDRDFAMIRVRMLAAATRLLDRLAAHVPVRDAVNAEAVFTNRNGDGAGCLLPQVSAMGLEQIEKEDDYGQTTQRRNPTRRVQAPAARLPA